MFSFIDDEFMPPMDPRGRNGPTLEQFLRFPTDEELARFLEATDSAAGGRPFPGAAGFAPSGRSPYQSRGGARKNWYPRGRSQSPPHSGNSRNPGAGAAIGANPYLPGGASAFKKRWDWSTQEDT